MEDCLPRPPPHLSNQPSSFSPVPPAGPSCPARLTLQHFLWWDLLVLTRLPWTSLLSGKPDNLLSRSRAFTLFVWSLPSCGVFCHRGSRLLRCCYPQYGRSLAVRNCQVRHGRVEGRFTHYTPANNQSACRNSTFPLLTPLFNPLTCQKSLDHFADALDVVDAK